MWGGGCVRRQNPRLRGMLDMEPGGPAPQVPRTADPHNLAEAARTALGSQFWQLRALSQHHTSLTVRQSAVAVAAMPADGGELPNLPRLLACSSTSAKSAEQCILCEGRQC